MRNIILVVASAVALSATTMTTGALAQRAHGSGIGGGAHFDGAMGSGARLGAGHFGGEPHYGTRLGRPEFEHRDFDRRFAFHRRFLGPTFGFVAAGPDWWDNDWDDGCLSRWERTPSGWRQRLC